MVALPRLELVTQHLSPDEGKTRKETVSPPSRAGTKRRGFDKKRAGEFHLSPLIPLFKPLTSARLLDSWCQVSVKPHRQPR